MAFGKTIVAIECGSLSQDISKGSYAEDVSHGLQKPHGCHLELSYISKAHALVLSGIESEITMFAIESGCWDVNVVDRIAIRSLVVHSYDDWRSEYGAFTLPSTNSRT